MRVRSPLRLGLILAFLFGSGLLACSASGHASADAPAAGPIEECEAFLTAYERCLDSLGPAWIAQARVEQTRAAFEAQAAEGPAAAGTLRKQCAERLSQVTTQCR